MSRNFYWLGILYKSFFYYKKIKKKTDIKFNSVELDERSINYRELFDRKEDKVCLVMWNEITWVNKEIMDISDEIVIIPMRWQKESLNVSVAAWIVMYAVN